MPEPHVTPGLTTLRAQLLRNLRPAWWPLLNRQTLQADALAAVLTAVLVLPQGIAFATLAGLPPQHGLYAAVLPGIVAALAGSSWHVVTGPTNANSLALAALLAPLAVAGTPEYVEMALALALLVGVLQLITGVLRLGAIANFISPTALLGFTSGAALLIFWHAVPQALGLPAGLLHEGPAAWWGAVTAMFDADPALYKLCAPAGTVPLNPPEGGWAGHVAVSPGALLVSATTLALAFGLRAWRPRWPFMLLSLVGGVLVGQGLGAACEAGWLGPGWRVGVVGELPSAIPPWHWPQVPTERWGQLLGLAAALTVVALSQSLAIAKSLAERSGQRIDANREFIGQGLANIVGGLSSSLVACGSLNRSLPHLEAGARTPLSGVLAGLLVVPLVAFSAPVLALIPHAAVAGLLMLVGWLLLAPAAWKALARASSTETVIAALTLLATLFLKLELAVLVGSALSLGAFLHRTSRPALRSMGFDRPSLPRPFVVLDDDAPPVQGAECPQLKLLRMEGSVYFGATAHVSEHLTALRRRNPNQRHLLVMAKSMNFVDVSGSAVWRQELHRRRSQGGDLYFHRPRPDVLALWERDGMLEALGPGHVFNSKHEALSQIVQHLDPAICAACRDRAFVECDLRPGAATSPLI